MAPAAPVALAQAALAVHTREAAPDDWARVATSQADAWLRRQGESGLPLPDAPARHQEEEHQAEP